MKVSITDVRRRLPALVKRIRASGTTVQITVRGKVVAELCAVGLGSAESEPEPGAAARAMLALRAKLPKTRGRKRHISCRVKEYLYGPRGVIG